MGDEEVRHGIIRLRLRDVSQLFNSLDPDPFMDRDLDRDTVEYICSWAREIPDRHPLRLILEISAPQPDKDVQALLEGAIFNYFTRMVELAANDFRDLMRRGRDSLLIGLSVLACAMLLSRWLGSHQDWGFATLLRETVLIGGWVAMWRPMEILLYDWWPLRRRRQDLERVRDMAIEVRCPGQDPHPAAPASD